MRNRDERPGKRLELEQMREKERGREARVRGSNKQQHQQNKWLFSLHNIQGFEAFSCADIIPTKTHTDRTTAFQLFPHNTQRKCNLRDFRNVENKDINRSSLREPVQRIGAQDGRKSIFIKINDRLTELTVGNVYCNVAIICFVTLGFAYFITELENICAVAILVNYVDSFEIKP